jgi:hypothetical protein
MKYLKKFNEALDQTLDDLEERLKWAKIEYIELRSEIENLEKNVYQKIKDNEKELFGSYNIEFSNDKYGDFDEEEDEENFHFDNIDPLSLNTEQLDWVFNKNIKKSRSGKNLSDSIVYKFDGIYQNYDTFASKYKLCNFSVNLGDNFIRANKFIKDNGVLSDINFLTKKLTKTNNKFLRILLDENDFVSKYWIFIDFYSDSKIVLNWEHSSVPGLNSLEFSSMLDAIKHAAEFIIKNESDEEEEEGDDEDDFEEDEEEEGDEGWGEEEDFEED